MQYRSDKYGNQISVLGYGCMRFTTSAGKIDIPKATEELRAAYEGGINYYDTAYLYTGSEAAVGEIFEKLGIRKQVYIATKIPHYLVKKAEDFDKYFEEQLRRLRTDYIDYYLMHMLTDADAWKRLCDLGILSWLEQKKKTGQIRQVGFSYHGGSEMFIKLLDSYDWDFCQIQYNYLDEYSQAGVKGLSYAAEKKIPVIIMEPLRGGRLADKLPPEAVKIFENYKVKRTPASWAFRWLYNQSEVTCVLSGMNSLEMVKENIKTASESEPGFLSEEEISLYKKVVAQINKKVKVPCTGCRYCVPCPKNVDIPGCFSAYNNSSTQGLFIGLKEYVMCMVLRKNYSGACACVECGKCEKHCPQGIAIRKELKAVKRRFENPPLRLVFKILPKILKY